MAGDHPPGDQRRVRPARRSPASRPWHRALVAAATTGAASMAALGIMASNSSAADSPRLRVDDASPSKLFGASGGSVDFEFEIDGRGSRDLTVEAVRAGGGVYRRWALEDVAGGERQRVSWNGKRDHDSVPNGEYFFRVRDERGRKADRDRPPPALGHTQAAHVGSVELGAN